jgi:hypothetical protein
LSGADAAQRFPAGLLLSLPEETCAARLPLIVAMPFSMRSLEMSKISTL